MSIKVSMQIKAPINHYKRLEAGRKTLHEAHNLQTPQALNMANTLSALPTGLWKTRASMAGSVGDQFRFRGYQ